MEICRRDRNGAELCSREGLLLSDDDLLARPFRMALALRGGRFVDGLICGVEVVVDEESEGRERDLGSWRMEPDPLFVSPLVRRFRFGFP